MVVVDACVVRAPNPSSGDHLPALFVLRLVPHEVGVHERFPRACGNGVDLLNVCGIATVRLLHQHVLSRLQRLNDHRLPHIGCGGDSNGFNLVIGEQFSIVAIDSGDIVFLGDLLRQISIQIGDRPGNGICAGSGTGHPSPANSAADYAHFNFVHHNHRLCNRSSLACSSGFSSTSLLTTCSGISPRPIRAACRSLPLQACM